MTDQIPALPTDVFDCGKAQVLALLALEPNKRIRAVIAEQLGAFLLAHAGELKTTPIRPSQQLAAVLAERPTPVVVPPGVDREIVEGEVRDRRHPGKER